VRRSPHLLGFRLCGGARAARPYAGRARAAAVRLRLRARGDRLAGLGRGRRPGGRAARWTGPHPAPRRGL
ncbi:MAG: hypothetical protein AVDCRST_MAG38-1647, partial [uncultured Solirubrobacteraceae bacterium]